MKFLTLMVLYNHYLLTQLSVAILVKLDRDFHCNVFRFAQLVFCNMRQTFHKKNCQLSGKQNVIYILLSITKFLPIFYIYNLLMEIVIVNCYEPPPPQIGTVCSPYIIYTALNHETSWDSLNQVRVYIHILIYTLIKVSKFDALTINLA